MRSTLCAGRMGPIVNYNEVLWLHLYKSRNPLPRESTVRSLACAEIVPTDHKTK